MDAKQSKNFFAELIEDLPATQTNAGGAPGKSIAKPFMRNTADSALRLEVWNYTSIPYLKGDIVVIDVDNYGIARVIDALSDSGMYVSRYSSGVNTPSSYGRPNLSNMVYAKGDTAANQLSSIYVQGNDTISPKTKRNQYANPFNFRVGPPALFANVHGFGYCYMDDAGDNDADKKYKMAEGMIPVAQDSRLHFRIPANDTTDFSYGDKVFLKGGCGAHFELSPNSAYDHAGCIVGICDSEKHQAVDYDFWMPFKPAGMLCSIDETVTSGNYGATYPGGRFGYVRDNDAKAYMDLGRYDYTQLMGGQIFYSPLFVKQYQAVAGTSYPVAVEMSDDWRYPDPVDIQLSTSQWMSNYGRGALRPEICTGDLITCIVDASGNTPVITPISFPMDYGYGVRMFFSSPPNGRLWQADIPQNNDVISITGSWHGKVVTDPNGTDLDIVGGGGIYEKITDNTVLVQGNH